MKDIFKVGDWAYYEFELYQVQEIRDGRLTLNNGYVEISNIHPYECWEQTTDIKVIADECKELYKEIRDIAGNININYPQIHTTVANYFHTICEFQNKPETQKITWQHLREFVIEVKLKIHEMRKVEVSGIPILRP